MELENLIEIVSIQSEIIEILSLEYLEKYKNTDQCERMQNLLDLLNKMYE